MEEWHSYWTKQIIIQKWTQFYQVVTKFSLLQTRRCFQQNCQKIPLPISYISSSLQFNLLLGIKIIWSSWIGYQTFINRIFLSDQYWKLFLNAHSYNLAKFLLSILHPLTRDQFIEWKNLFPLTHCYKLSNSKYPSTLLSLIKHLWLWIHL